MGDTVAVASAIDDSIVPEKHRLDCCGDVLDLCEVLAVDAK